MSSQGIKIFDRWISRWWIITIIIFFCFFVVGTKEEVEEEPLKCCVCCVNLEYVCCDNEGCLGR